MRIRRRLFVLALLALLGTSLIFFKDVAAKFYLERYLRSRLGGQCTIEQVGISYNSLVVRGMRLEHDYFRLSLARLKIDFSFPEFIKPHISRIAVYGLEVKIDNPARTQALLKKFLGKPSAMIAAGPSQKASAPAGYELALEAIRFVVEESDFYLDTAFSFAGVVSPQRLPELKRLRVDNFKLRTGYVSGAFHIQQKSDNRYILYIDSIKRGDKEIKGIILTLELIEDAVVIRESPFVFLGPAASIQGRLEFFNFDHFCLLAFLRTASFAGIVQFFGQEQNIRLSGPFNGELRLCWEKGGFSDITALFSSAEAGSIHIRKEVSFDFLKKYLDQKSRKALVDSFNNYSYNNGTLAIKKEADAISFHFDFDSEERGRRNVVVKYHMNADE